MNGRILHAETPEARMAAVFFTLIDRWVTHPVPGRVDYTDLANALRPIIQRELLQARIEESGVEQTPENQRKLREDLIVVTASIAANPLWRL